MKRRDVLKSIGIIPVAATIPLAATVEVMSQEEIINFNKVLHLMKKYEKNNIFSTNEKVKAIKSSVSMINEAPPFTCFTMKDTEFVEAEFSFIYGLALITLETWHSNIEKGRDFPSMKDLVKHRSFSSTYVKMSDSKKMV